MTIEEEKAMLEEQFFSLAKHAANYSQNNRSKHPVDEQYISLMNHAAKMYRQLIDK
ncbi:hypothetical protein QNH10_06295 [Sporosarcina thermotolerans]|nr:hypothetical protein [Sporosarcina thermotolerans]WHT49228.1 hypothetical protein QNH10_06295 [Sporosarcina thermotolerans]